tara:strand:+ start:231 stop:365 length:135 start_codon:yes stop_codon:yes gene_type:complete
MAGFLVAMARAEVFEKFCATISELNIGPFSAAAILIIHRNSGID